MSSQEETTLTQENAISKKDTYHRKMTYKKIISEKKEKAIVFRKEKIVTFGFTIKKERYSIKNLPD